MELKETASLEIDVSKVGIEAYAIDADGVFYPAIAISFDEGKEAFTWVSDQECDREDDALVAAEALIILCRMAEREEH